MTKIAMLQPNYIPWKGVFDLIRRVDIFVFYDDVQYTKKDWRSRNRVKTPNGEIWLSVPVKHSRQQLICDSEIDTKVNWQTKHYKTLEFSYRKAPFFKDYEYLLHEIYLKRTWTNLSELDIFSTKLIAQALGIECTWKRASELKISGNKNGEKVIRICNLLGASHFINGPTSKAFMDEALFLAAGIGLEYMNYDYDEYPQLYPPFSHHVSVLDTLFNCGPDARKFIEPRRAQ